MFGAFFRFRSDRPYCRPSIVDVNRTGQSRKRLHFSCAFVVLRVCQPVAGTRLRLEPMPTLCGDRMNATHERGEKRPETSSIRQTRRRIRQQLEIVREARLAGGDVELALFVLVAMRRSQTTLRWVRDIRQQFAR
uniref:Uncharacterized protein n=2 Tax=Cupriavidus TaxID=106589 RepID=Q475F3_CUPPJ